MSKETVIRLVNEQEVDLKIIGEKILDRKRITDEEGLLLFEKGSLSYLGSLANFVREKPAWIKNIFQPQLSY